MGEYIDKKVGKDENDKGSLKYLVNEEFKAIEKRDGIGYRDDQEIRNAGRNICNKLINEIKNDSKMVYGPWALKPLNNLIAELKKEYANMKGLKLKTNNKDKINQVANRIDNAENETLKRLSKNRTTQDSRDIVNKSKEKSKDKTPMFVMEGGNDIKKQTGNIIFTKAANPVKIHNACKGLFNNPNNAYTIDYSGCTNASIKSWMKSVIGTYTCTFTYDKQLNTYVLRDPKGEPLKIRARIREGVKLIPQGVKKRNSYVEEKKGNKNLGQETTNGKKLNDLTSNMLKDIPSAEKKLTQKEQILLCQKTEERLNILLKKAKSLGYEIDPECITKKWTGSGHMELHLNSGSSETSWTVIENANQIGGKNIYDFIDSNEGNYKTYLTKRVKEKRQQFEKLTKTEKINVSKKTSGKGETDEKSKDKEKQHKQDILYGIGLFEQMVDNYRESEGDSRLDNDDKDLVQIKKLIRNAKASIEDSDGPLDDNIIIKNYVNPMWEKWKKIKNISKTINTRTTSQGHGETYTNKAYNQQYNQFKKVFFGGKTEQISAIRSLGGHGRLLDNTETSFLANEIEGNDDLQIKDNNIQTCLNKIKKECSVSIYNKDGTINTKAKNRYDNLFYSAKRGTNNLISLFVGRGWLPKNWKKEESKVKECMDKLRTTLVKADNVNLNTEINSLKTEAHQRKIKLEQKSNKTENDLKELQALEYLESNPDKQQELYKKTVEETRIEFKYGGNLGQTIRGGLFSALAELGGGVKGENADIYNDIKGYGAWNLSDENAKLAGEIIVDIVITVAVAVVTAGTGAVAMAALLRGVAGVARAAKWVNVANRVYKATKILKTGYKGFKAVGYAGKATSIALNGSALLIEGTAFNAASNIIHSAMNGTSLDNLNLNPTAKENVQTAAFLGTLSIAGRLTNSLIKAGGRTKVSMNLKEGLKKAHLQSPTKFTAGLVSEMGSMLAAEQAINFTFGHDVVDPETGEIRTERFHAPTKEELIQMTGMILAFKTVKPGLWHRYEQNLNNGTLEICRSTKKNEILIRDPKTGKVEKIQDLIDGKSDTGKKGSTIEQREEQERRQREEQERRQREEQERKQREEQERRQREEQERKQREEQERRSEEIQYIDKIKRDLSFKESMLEGDENEAEVLSRLIERQKSKGELTGKRKEKVEVWEQNLAKRKEDINKLKEEIQRDRDIIRKYEEQYSQQEKP